MGTTRRVGLPDGLRTAFSREKQFKGANIELALRFTRAGWLLGVVVAYALFPFYPPTVELGTAGILLAPGATSVGTVGLLYVLYKHGDRMTYNTLLVTSYMGVAFVATEQWLAGGVPAPYHELYPFMICGAAAVHPPRRFIPFMLITSIAVIAPEIGQASPAQMGDLVTELVLWLGASVFVMVVMLRLRQHRADLEATEAQAQELARVDSLTGLGNRRAFEEILVAEISRSGRAGTPLSLIVCDLDSFKEINDRYGHLAGDECLRAVAETLSAELRLVDHAFRWGGDEFVVLLVDTHSRGAAEVSERLEHIIQNVCSRPDGTPVFVTSGHAEFHSGMTGEELLAAADLALRERKESRSPGDARTPLQ
jgi:diguanylate cyclase (GGDEF)-like protein